ncbi:MAG: DUF2244 domain-containing protein [Alphaproteobacteria bacterium]|nr:DUF2244 domain-containing protein [Alphaproteobacteria bacterium]
MLFEAAIVPHRSLSPRQLKLLLGLLAGMSCLVMTLLWLLGAWPVIGLSGTEIILVIALVRVHAAGARAGELVMLTGRELLVVRTDSNGRRQQFVLDPAWLLVSLEERRGRVPALWLVAREHRTELGASLGEPEKRALARSLAAALDRLRNPRFDNPQLRD